MQQGVCVGRLKRKRSSKVDTSGSSSPHFSVIGQIPNTHHPKPTSCECGEMVEAVYVLN